VLDTGALTQHVLDALALLSWLEVGDGVAPTAGGWSEGQPNVGQFVPYTVVSFAGARPRTPELSLSKQTTAWVASFQLKSHGGSREQCDWAATQVRVSIDDLLKTSAGDWQLDFIEWQTLGGVVRNDAVDPPIWSASDSLTFHVVKRGV